MKVTRKKAKLLSSVIHGWVADGVLSHELGEKLIESYEVVSFDWKRLAKYSFWISLACIVIAVGSIVADKALMDLLARIFQAPAIINSLFFVLVASAFFYLGIRRKKKTPEKVFSNEAVFFLGVLATAAAIAFFGEAIDRGSGDFSFSCSLPRLSTGSWACGFPQN